MGVFAFHIRFDGTAAKCDGLDIILVCFSMKAGARHHNQVYRAYRVRQFRNGNSRKNNMNGELRNIRAVLMRIGPTGRHQID